MALRFLRIHTVTWKPFGFQVTDRPIFQEVSPHPVIRPAIHSSRGRSLLNGCRWRVGFWGPVSTLRCSLNFFVVVTHHQTDGAWTP